MGNTLRSSGQMLLSEVLVVKWSWMLWNLKGQLRKTSTEEKGSFFIFTRYAKRAGNPQITVFQKTAFVCLKQVAGIYRTTEIEKGKIQIRKKEGNRSDEILRSLIHTYLLQHLQTGREDVTANDFSHCCLEGTTTLSPFQMQVKNSSWYLSHFTKDSSRRNKEVARTDTLYVTRTKHFHGWVTKTRSGTYLSAFCSPFFQKNMF